MSWANNHIEKLKQGHMVSFRPRGNSMKGKIESGQKVIVAPVNGKLEIGDIVLCKVKGKQYLHLIKAVRGEQYLIGNNRGGINGWVSGSQIFGKFKDFA